MRSGWAHLKTTSVTSSYISDVTMNRMKIFSCTAATVHKITANCTRTATASINTTLHYSCTDISVYSCTLQLYTHQCVQVNSISHTKWTPAVRQFTHTPTPIIAHSSCLSLGDAYSTFLDVGVGVCILFTSTSSKCKFLYLAWTSVHLLHNE